jgi:hypothetical protein
MYLGHVSDKKFGGSSLFPPLVTATNNLKLDACAYIFDVVKQHFVWLPIDQSKFP